MTGGGHPHGYGIGENALETSVVPVLSGEVAVRGGTRSGPELKTPRRAGRFLVGRRTSAAMTVPMVSTCAPDPLH
jgi:hypothetical protein